MPTTTARDRDTELDLPRGVRSVFVTRVTGQIVHEVPRRGLDNWTSRPSLLSAWVDGLEGLGLTDPTGAGDHLARALQLKAEASRSSDDPDGRRGAIASDLAAGTITPAKATAELDKLTTARADDEQRDRDRRDTLRDAAHRAYRAGLEELHAAGDALILDVLRPVVTDALAEPGLTASAERWNAAHDLAAVLRSRALVPAATGAKAREYQLARPDAAHRWRLANAKDITAHRWLDHDDRTRSVLFRPVDAPPLTFEVIAANAEPWGAGLLTAAEVAKLPTLDGVHADT